MRRSQIAKRGQEKERSLHTGPKERASVTARGSERKGWAGKTRREEECGVAGGCRAPRSAGETWEARGGSGVLRLH